MIRNTIFNLWKKANLAGCKVSVKVLEKCIPHCKPSTQKELRAVAYLTEAIAYDFKHSVHSYAEWIAYLKGPEYLQRMKDFDWDRQFGIF